MSLFSLLILVTIIPNVTPFPCNYYKVNIVIWGSGLRGGVVRQYAAGWDAEGHDFLKKVFQYGKLAKCEGCEVKVGSER